MVLRGAVVVLCVWAGSAAADAEFELIAKTGDTLPGLSGPVVNLSHYAPTSATGEVAFPAYDGSGKAVYRWTSGGTRTLAWVGGTAIPGMNGSYPVNEFGLPDFFIHADSTLRACSSDGDAPCFVQPRAGSPTKILDLNTPCPTPADGNVLGGPVVIDRWSSTGSVMSISACGGTLVGYPAPFTEVLDGVPPGYSSEWLTAGNTPGAAAPNGDVVVVMHAGCLDPPGPCSELTHAALYRIRTGTATMLVKRGDTITGAPGALHDFGAVSTSADGGIAAIVWFDVGGGNYTTGVIHVDSGGAVRYVTKVGDPAPGGLGAIISIAASGGLPGEIVALTGNRVGLQVITTGNTSGFYNALVRWSATTGTLEKAWALGELLPGTDIGVIGVQKQQTTPTGRNVLFVFGTSPSVPGLNFLVRELADGTFERLLYDGETIQIQGLAAPFTAQSFDILDGQGTSAEADHSAIDDSGGFPALLSYQDGLGNETEVLVWIGGGLVVNSHDDDPLAAGATACTTGQMLANGVPECTLRAAIQLANARGRESTITFSLPTGDPIVANTELPTITVPLTIDGTSEGRVELTTNVSGTVGLRSDAKLVVRALNIRGFGVGGIVANAPAGIELYTSEIADNAGYGIGNLNGSVTLDGVALLRNGETGAFMMGPPLLDRDLTVTNSTIADNDEAGLVAKGYISLRGATITGNGGAGAVVGDGGAFRTGITIMFHDTPTTITSNKGDGLRTDRGDIEIADKAVIEGNFGWGVRARGRVTIGDEAFSGMRSIRVNSNGGGTMCASYDLDGAAPVLVDVPCGGGGVMSALLDLQDTNRITDLVAQDNAGPGVIANSGISLMHVELRRNQGVGAGVTDASIGARGLHINGVLGSVISDNAGHGLWYDGSYGAVTVTAGVIANNGNWGIYTRQNVWIGNSEDLAPGWARAEITGNGAATTCFTYAAIDNDIVASTRGCGPGGGVFAEYEAGNEINRVFDVLIRGNAGPGVMALGQILLSAAEIDDNGGPGVFMASEERGFGSNAIATNLRPVIVSNNSGDAVLANSGPIELGARIEVFGNAGRGIATEYGDVKLTSQGRSDISSNGGGLDCRPWQYTMRGFPEPVDGPCPAPAGVFAERHVTGSDFDITGNQGDGIVSLTGKVTISNATICRNTGKAVVAPEQELTNVDTCGGGGGGCLSVGHTGGERSAPPWLPALAIVLLLHRRRRWL